MKRIIISFGCLMAACVAIAGTGMSNEFRLDCRTGVRTAAATEKIQYSTAWATNLTAAQQGEAKAVVKVNPCLKTPPKYLVVDMSGGRSAARWPVSYLDEVPSGGWTDEYKTEKLVLRYIPAGSFIMGGRATDYPGAVNTNLHMVTLTKPFYIGVFECTQRQWELVMGNRPSFFTNETCWATRPVDQVSYLDIRGSVFGREWPKHMMVDDGSFLGVVRAKTGNLLFDLPTDAQWEYACRAGTTTALNSGKNLTGEMDCENMNEVARYRFNSNNDNLTQDEKANCTVQYCSAKVGSYIPNGWGLFDMHGNLWEHCIDRALALAVGSIDPTGGNDTALTKRVIRGGGYNEDAWRCRSAFRYSYTFGHGYSQTGRGSTVGFRICLHDATVYPSADSATVLINASGASAADWTPTQAGTYQLTHEVQVDGVTVAPMESALFRVDGPELKIVPMGEMTNGVAVKVEVEGVGIDSGWQVYYTTDGSEPTEGSTVYEGPFVLPESATVKAVAISAGGVLSEVASKELLLSPALAVEDVAARQRYPWNGKVDIDCEVKGAENEDYLVSLVACNLDGGTNLPLRTAWQTGGTITNNAFLVKPGAHRFTWDAAADITNDCEFANVVVSVSAEHSAIIAAKKVLTLEVAGYAGTETLTNVPVLVRLSTSINGFSYADFVDAKGGDLIFTDESGSMIYPHEIDEWNTDGESLVWVKLPRMVNGTKFKMAYSNSQLITHTSQLSSHEVWRDYAGVWHMNEDSGTAYDSTAHGLDALPSKGTNTLADVSQMVAYENGACGRARVNGTSEIRSGNYMIVPSYDALKLSDSFVASGWFKVEGVKSNPKMLFRGNNWKDGGWGAEFARNWNNVINVCGSDNTTYLECCTLPVVATNWVFFAFSYNGDNLSLYCNGSMLTNAVIISATDNGLPMAIGSSAIGDSNSLNGQYDEIRLRGGALSADRIKADYDMIVNRNFLRYGPVENGKGEAE